MKGPLGEILDQTGDGGDSCNFTCAYWFFKGCNEPRGLGITGWFLTREGPVRHPEQVPWNNPKNFTIDQAVPWLAIAPKGYARQFFRANTFFAPNIERDHKGSKKLPYPHEFFKDSRLVDPVTKQVAIDTTTLPGRGKLFSNMEHTIESKAFDYADPVQPDFFGLMVMRSKLIWLYPLLPICYLWCIGSILSHCLIYARSKENNDFKQLFILSTFYRLEKMFLRLHPYGLLEASRLYFIEERNLPELHSAFESYLKRKGLYEMGLKNQKETSPLR